jgi:hypothetical protein
MQQVEVVHVRQMRLVERPGSLQRCKPQTSGRQYGCSRATLP